MQTKQIKWLGFLLVLSLGFLTGCGCGDDEPHHGWNWGGDNGDCQSKSKRYKKNCQPDPGTDGPDYPRNGNANTNTGQTDQVKACFDHCSTKHDKDYCEKHCGGTSNGNGNGSAGNGNTNGSTGNGNTNGSTGNGNTNGSTGSGNTNGSTGHGNTNGSTGNGNTNGGSGTGSGTNPPIDSATYKTCWAACKKEGKIDCVCNSTCQAAARATWVAKCWESCINDKGTATTCKAKCG